jgi:hypothetical protein
MLKINFYKKNKEWVGVYFIDKLPDDVDELALGLLVTYSADCYRISLV